MDHGSTISCGLWHKLHLSLQALLMDPDEPDKLYDYHCSISVKGPPSVESIYGDRAVTLDAVFPIVGQPSIMMRFDNFNTLAALNVAAANAAAADKIGNKRVYYCQRCLNHNRLEPRKNHKCECIYATCTCNKCILVEKRRVLNTQLHELEEIVDGGIQADIDEQFNPGGTRIKGGYFEC
ncbi:Protein male abnormal 3 [Toxocara canis]|uniref:Protein male abnormal 3 n=1 Tax=Toxocara canis TaxID=6265 RepID=A0A0B2VWI7_TOXCA|nr:Protein male abnormal 3 [Toxocara canis]